MRGVERSTSIYAGLPDARASSPDLGNDRSPILIDRPVSEPQNGCSINPQKHPRPSVPSSHARLVSCLRNCFLHAISGSADPRLGSVCSPACRSEKGNSSSAIAAGKSAPKSADDLDTRYLFEVNTCWTIDGATRRNKARYINHSCRPNAEVYFVKHAIKIRAIKNIKAGDEITYHYGRNYFEAFIKPVGCRCLACARRKARQRAESRARQARRMRRAKLHPRRPTRYARPLRRKSC